MSNPDIIKRAECLIEAYQEALPLIPSAIYQETGYQLGQVIHGFIPALLQTLAVLGISMVAGAGAGAVIGFFLGGVGVAPGAVVGGQLGLDMGAVILTWLGLKFLVESIGQGLGELVSTLDHAVWIAWIAADRDRTRYYHIDQAAHGLARCAGILFRLILQGIVAMIVGKGGMSVGKGMVSSGRAILSEGVEGGANIAVADVVAQLRQSKLPKAFADWVEQNWEDLIRNPKLQGSKAETLGGTAEATEAVSPSQITTAENKVEQPATDPVAQEARTSIKSTNSSTPSKTKSDRLQYMGRTPSKYSHTGREVLNRMRSEELIQGEGPLLPGNPNELEVIGSDGKWYNIDRTVDMAHKIDAVSWWNEKGRFFGPKSPEVREFMLDSNNYRLEPQSINRSAGAKLGQKYMPPESPSFDVLE